MFNRIIIIMLFYNVISLFITILSRDMFMVYFFYLYLYISILFLYVCTFMAIGNASLMLFVNKHVLSANSKNSIF